MSEPVECARCGVVGKRRRGRIAPEGWFYTEILTEDDDPSNPWYRYACSAACCEIAWKPGPGDLGLRSCSALEALESSDPTYELKTLVARIPDDFERTRAGQLLNELLDAKQEATKALRELYRTDGNQLRCPGCGAAHPSETGRRPCCNSECGGQWGTGCYHCHHPDMAGPLGKTRPSQWEFHYNWHGFQAAAVLVDAQTNGFIAHLGLMEDGRIALAGSVPATVAAQLLRRLGFLGTDPHSRSNS